ncbi:OmpA family protein [Parablastomonas sp. CN1-191]|uniref:OmpA family protein n=1 Tax=Parablastomonas sp. CN1-191 TaxID=3400908 RepID=UPI003BF7DA5F
MTFGTPLVIAAGAAAAALLAVAGTALKGPELVAAMRARSQVVMAGTGVSAQFVDGRRWLTRHPVLVGGTDLPPHERARLATAVAAIPGVGGVTWRDPLPQAALAEATPTALHCQDDVDGILKARSIRFRQGSAEIDPASIEVVNEVARALEPCTGSVIAIVGHTDANGNEDANVALSSQRAAAVRNALAQRGLPERSLRAKGVGSAEPIAGLEPSDPANRRIEFSLIVPAVLRPTPIDTPGAR